MNAILSNYSVSISELKKSPSSIIEEAGDEAVAILNHNKASAYLVPAQTYEKLMEIVDVYMLANKVKERLANPKVLKDKLSWFEDVYKIKLKMQDLD